MEKSIVLPGVYDLLSLADQLQARPTTPEEAAILEKLLEGYAESGVWDVKKTKTDSGWSCTFSLKFPSIFPQQLDPDSLP